LFRTTLVKWYDTHFEKGCSSLCHCSVKFFLGRVPPTAQSASHVDLPTAEKLRRQGTDMANLNSCCGIPYSAIHACGLEEDGITMGIEKQYLIQGAITTIFRV